MLDRLSLCAAAMFAATSLAAAPASAQTEFSDLTQAQKDEMYCVYDSVFEHDAYRLISSVRLSGETSGKDYEDASRALERAANECGSKYKWDETRSGIAKMIGLHGSVADAISEDLIGEGVKDEQLDKLYGMIDELSDKDADAILAGSWRRDDGLRKRLGDQLKTAGLPEDQKIMDNAFRLIEASMNGIVTSYDWIDYAIDG